MAEGAGIGFRALRYGVCRWPLWPHRGPVPPVDDQRYCGEPTGGRGYCERHRRMAAAGRYTPEREPDGAGEGRGS